MADRGTILLTQRAEDAGVSFQSSLYVGLEFVSLVSVTAPVDGKWEDSGYIFKVISSAMISEALTNVMA